MDCLKGIVVGVDFSHFSHCALKQAARIASRIRASSQHPVHGCLRHPRNGPNVKTGGGTVDEPPAVLASLEATTT